MLAKIVFATRLSKSGRGERNLRGSLSPPTDKYVQIPNLQKPPATLIGVVIAIWAPIVLVVNWMHKDGMQYFLLCLVGFIEPSAIWGETRTLGMLRSSFESVPSAFSDRLMPSSENKNAKKTNMKM